MGLTPLISNQYGNYGIKDITKCSGWDIVSLDEGLVPFINELDATRAILAYTHRAQASPIINGDEPIVATGAEFFIPQLSSNRFIQRAKHDGEVIEVKKDNYLKVKYKKTSIVDFIDISPRLATTKRASYVNLGMDTVQPGIKFEKDQPIAWSHNFNGECYTSGKNLKMAIMNYLGFSHEDGYVISHDTSNNYQTEVIEEIKIIIPENVKVFNLIDKIGHITQPKESLLEFSYSGMLEDYLDKYDILDSDSEEIDAALYNAAGNKIKLESTGGEIVQIRVYLNTRDKVDPMVIDLWNIVTANLKSREKLYSKTSIGKESKLSATDNLDMSQLKIGSHKHKGQEFEGAKISYFIKKTKTLNVGDKMSNRYGGKGVITKIINPENTPRGEFTGNIDIFISPISVLGRKNMAVIKELYIGKIFYNLPKIIKDKLNNKYDTLKDIKSTIIGIYELLDASSDKKLVKSITSKLTSLPDVKLRKMINNFEIKFNYIIEPFTNVKMENIKNAADLLDIELDEKIFIPELNMWTKNKVPVGINYMDSMEQLATDYESLRSTGGYVGITGQPKKGKSENGGQSIGNLDLYNLLTYDCPAILEEFMTIRSDDFHSKRIVVTDIIQTGNSQIPKVTGNANTKNLYNIHMIAMGLDVSL